MEAGHLARSRVCGSPFGLKEGIGNRARTSEKMGVNPYREGAVVDTVPDAWLELFHRVRRRMRIEEERERERRLTDRWIARCEAVTQGLMFEIQSEAVVRAQAFELATSQRIGVSTLQTIAFGEGGPRITSFTLQSNSSCVSLLAHREPGDLPAIYVMYPNGQCRDARRGCTAFAFAVARTVLRAGRGIELRACADHDPTHDRGPTDLEGILLTAFAALVG